MRGQNVTADLQDLAALVGGSWPYETAAGVLERLSGVQLSEERLRQLTNEQGTALAKRQHSEAQRGLKEAIDMSEIRAQREHSQDTRLPNSVEWLQVGLDGGWLPSREQPGGMEGKMGVVAGQIERVGKQGHHRLTKRRSVATFGSTRLLVEPIYGEPVIRMEMCSPFLCRADATQRPPRASSSHFSKGCHTCQVLSFLIS